MKLRLLTLFFIVFIGAFTFGRAQNICPIIPMPNYAKSTEGKFILNENTQIISAEPLWQEVVYTFKNQVLHYTGIALNTRGNDTQKIILQKVEKDKNSTSGSYTLDMNAATVRIKAADKAGIFNGLQSFLQLALFSRVKANQELQIPTWQLKDQPLYGWRGFMLDESRHFFGKKIVKQILDQMALLKLNRFHWHLTDSQGWRLQIKAYPKLTLVGGIGNDTDSLKPAQYYTQADIREIVNYAKARNIEIVPEIDMPGHATAANRAYPEFSGGKMKKYPDFTFNPGKEETYAYLGQILKETAVLFPFGRIHLGGDEVSYGIKAWENNPQVQQLMKEKKWNSLQQVEHYFFRQMTQIALQRFTTVMAWDEAVDSGISPRNSIIYWWRHDRPEQLVKALSKGFNVILSPRIPLYFDFVQHESHRLGRRWGKAFSSVALVYNFTQNMYLKEPVDKGNILGIQANLWTEKVISKKRLDFMIFPRLAALAEAAWTQPKKRNFPKFLTRLKPLENLYQNEGIYFFNPETPKKTPEVIDFIN